MGEDEWLLGFRRGSESSWFGDESTGKEYNLESWSKPAERMLGTDNETPHYLPVRNMDI